MAARKEIEMDGQVYTVNGVQMIGYPLRLRENCEAWFRLPADLTVADVLRITEFLRTLPLPQRVEPTSRTSGAAADARR